MPLRKLGFLTIGLFDEADPRRGHESTLEIIQLGVQVSTFSGTEGIEEFSPRVQPHSPGLLGRMWYGGGSARSAQWAGENGMNFLTSNVVAATDASTDFDEIQLDLIRTYRKHSPEGRVSHGFVVIPTDSAIADQRARYEDYVQILTDMATKLGPGLGWPAG